MEFLWTFHDGRTLLFYTRVGDGFYEKLCFHVDESALSIERPPEALKIDVFSRVVWLGMCIL